MLRYLLAPFPLLFLMPLLFCACSDDIRLPKTAEDLEYLAEDAMDSAAYMASDLVDVVSDSLQDVSVEEALATAEGIFDEVDQKFGISSGIASAVKDSEIGRELLAQGRQIGNMAVGSIGSSLRGKILDESWEKMLSSVRSLRGRS